MSSIIQITPEYVEQKVGELKRLKVDYDNNVASIVNLIRSVESVWRGDAQAAFLSKLDAMQKNFKTFSSMLDDYAGLMSTAAKDFREADIRLKNAMPNR